MTYEAWDIVLLPFPFTDPSSDKKRPVLVLSPLHYNTSATIVVMFVTSNLSGKKKYGDYTIKEWEKAGLPKPAKTRMKIATISEDLVVKKIARLTPFDIELMKKMLGNFFGIA